MQDHQKLRARYNIEVNLLNIFRVRIIDRYITGEVLRPFLLGTGLLILIFAGYSTAIRLADAANGLISPTTVAMLTALNTLIALEVLMPTALFLSVLTATGRLYRDSEMAALHAAGVSELRIFIAVFKLALLVAMITGFLSLVGRPWAYLQTYQLEAAAQQAFQLDRIEAGSFIELPDSGYVLYARGVDRRSNTLQGVFLHKEHDERIELVTAREATINVPGPDQRLSVEFTDGYLYLLDKLGTRDVTQIYGTLLVRFAESESQTRYRRKAQPSTILMSSPELKDIAEMQWRLSTPLATVLLALLALPLARSGPRQSGIRGIVFGLAIYTLFFGVAAVARNLLEDGDLPPAPGLWSSYVLLAILVTALAAAPRLRLARSGR